MGFLGKGGCRRVRANDSDPTAVQKEDEAAGRAGEIWGRRRGGRGALAAGTVPAFPCPPTSASHLVLPTCAQVTSDSSQRHRSVHPSALPFGSPCPRPGFWAQAEAWLVLPPSTPAPPPRPGPALLQKRPRQVQLLAGASHKPERAPGARTGHAQWRPRAKGSALAPGAAAPAPPRPSLPRRGLARLPPPLRLPGAGLPARRRRRRGRAGRRAVMWRDSLCTAAGYAPGRRAAAALGSLLSEAAAMMEV